MSFNKICGFVCCLSSLLLSACAGKDSVLFVTATNVGIDFDSTPPNVAIAYDRYEGYFGPQYENGAIAPVVGRLEANLSLFTPQLRQVYATGDAARLVTKKTPSDTLPRKPLKGDKRVAFFGTSSNIGLKVTFSPEGFPESLSIGYKRKEVSLVPITQNSETQEDEYGSVLAAIAMNINTPQISDVELGVSQFFATGIAADQLASENQEIRDVFYKMAKDSIKIEEAQFVEDDAGKKLESALKADPTFRDKLKQWMGENQVKTTVTLLAYGDEYAMERKAAVAELLP